MSERQPGSIGRSAPHTVHVLPHSESVIPRFLQPAIDRISPDAGATQLLIITADADTALAIAEAARSLVEGSAAPIVPVTSATRGSRLLASRQVPAIAATATTLVSLLKSSSVKLDGVQAVVIAWADELFDAREDETLEVVLAEIPKEASRIVVADRMTPAAVIPMNTPEEAIAELEYVTKQLGLKVVMLGSMIRRPIPAHVEKHPDMINETAWFDTLGLDSEYDYDAVWAKCVELGLSPTFHSGGRGYGLRLSPTNFTYNHIGHFGVAGEAVCKALFLGGVTRRFPRLKFAFLEGGVGWACQLYADLIGHWDKRHLEALEEVNPRNMDHAQFLKFAEQYGPPEMVDALRRRKEPQDATSLPERANVVGGIENLDDYAVCQIKQKSDLRDLFVDSFYFGCEADDPTNAWGFSRRNNPFNARINALFGSDIGHFDVPNMADVVPEAYELVEDGLITEGDFRDFVFANAVRFWGVANPNFFKDTVVEKEAAAVLAEGNK